jgi:hypothetical protein
MITLPEPDKGRDEGTPFARLADRLRDPIVLAMLAAALMLGWALRGGGQGATNAVTVIAGPPTPVAR